MHAVVLVGGFGTRLRPLTETTPKPLLPVGHVPLIVRLIRRLEQGGVDHVTLALGFRAEPFLAAFPDHRCGDVRLHYAVEPEPLDTAGAIRFAAEHTGIDDTFVVANGDVLTDLDVGALVDNHRRAGGEAMLHLVGVADPSSFGVADLGADGRILQFVEKPAPGTEPSNLANAGTYVFERAVLDRIPPGHRASIERETFPALAADGAVFGHTSDVYWLDAGRPELYLQANIDLVNGRREERCEAVADGAWVATDAVLVDSLVAPGATVASGVTLTSSVVLSGAEVGVDAVVERSIVMGAVGARAHLRGSVIGKGAAVPEDARLVDARVPDPTDDATHDGAVAEVEGVEGGTDDGDEGGTDGDDGARPMLVVGGAGFIGSHLVDRLVAEGAAVDVADDLSTGSLASLGDARAVATRGQLRIHTLDAGAAELAELITLRRPTTIYHLALLPGHDAAALDQGRSFTSMLAVLDAARRAGVAKIVVALPATAMYGHPSPRDVPVKEGPLVPRGLRGVVAKAIVDLLTVYREQWGIEFTALAVASVYGARQRSAGGVVAAALEAASRGEPARLNGDGRQTRDFLYVDDAVDALVRAGQRGSGLVVNVGTGVQTSLRDLWARIAPDGVGAAFGSARPDELGRFALSPIRARIHLGWSPWTSLDDGLAELRGH